MKKILAVNAGSSSLKFQLLNMPEEDVITEGVFERIGSSNAMFTIKVDGEKVKDSLVIEDHEVAVKHLITSLTKFNIINDLEDIKGVGHRVVHGGEIFNESVIIDESVIDSIEQLSDLAPLHNPANLTGIKAFKKLLPNVEAVAVFDTAFHQTMTEEAYMYATPYEWYENHSVRKYGFHGTSHQYVSDQVAKIMDNEHVKTIVCHLGNGASLCAVESGKSVDTSMGFTPLDGLVMGTRSGSIDPAVISYIAKKENKSFDEMDHDLNKRSGLLGVSGVSNDSRDMEEGANKGHKRSQLAQDLFVRRVVSYIGAYNVLLDGTDAIAFTAGIGENSITVREEIMKRLSSLGVSLDQNRNNVRGKEQLISSDDSKVKCFVIPTNEEVMIARDVMRLSK